MRIWIVVQTFKGFIQRPFIFLSKDEAYFLYNKLLQEINRDYDEVNIFEEFLTQSFKSSVNQK